MHFRKPLAWNFHQALVDDSCGGGCVAEKSIWSSKGYNLLELTMTFHKIAVDTS